MLNDTQTDSLLHDLDIIAGVARVAAADAARAALAATAHQARSAAEQARSSADRVHHRAKYAYHRYAAANDGWEFTLSASGGWCPSCGVERKLVGPVRCHECGYDPSYPNVRTAAAAE